MCTYNINNARWCFDCFVISLKSNLNYICDFRSKNGFHIEEWNIKVNFRKMQSKNIHIVTRIDEIKSRRAASKTAGNVN